MKRLEKIGLMDVQGFFDGPEGRVWRLLMGQQMHVGGFDSSRDLAERAGIGPGMTGVDLGCGVGAGVRFLLRFREVDYVWGVDISESMIQEARRHSRRDHMGDASEFVVADAATTPLEDRCVDFVWGEDAWSYVLDAGLLLDEVARLIRPGGIVAFTDWAEGPAALANDEATRVLEFVRRPGLMNLDDYVRLLEQRDFSVELAEDTDRLAPCMDIYLDQVAMQLQYDVLQEMLFNTAEFETWASEMAALRDLAHEGKIAQVAVIAVKES